MTGADVAFGLHFYQTGYGALKFKRAFPFGIQMRRVRFGRENEESPVLVQGINQHHKAPRFVAVMRSKEGNAVEDHAVITRCHREVISGGQGVSQRSAKEQRATSPAACGICTVRPFTSKESGCGASPPPIFQKHRSVRHRSQGQGGSKKHPRLSHGPVGNLSVTSVPKHLSVV